MELLYILYTHNRREILRECMRSLFENNDLRPSRMVIIDDGSESELKNRICELHANGTFDFMSFHRQVGYGRTAEIGFALAKMYNPKYCFFLESDYVFRKHGLDDVMEVFKSDIGQKLAGIAGYSHPDFFNPAFTGPDGMYVQKMKKRHGFDPLNRDMMYKPFQFNERLQVQYVSNSCGTMYLNWELIAEMKKVFPSMDRKWIDAACSKDSVGRLLNDEIMSQELAWFWSMYAPVQLPSWDTTKYGPLADIIPSVANHINGGGITTPEVPEGETIGGSPSFPKDYNA